MLPTPWHNVSPLLEELFQLHVHASISCIGIPRINSDSTDERLG